MNRMKSLVMLCVLLSSSMGALSYAADKTLIDYFLPMPIQSPLRSDIWGAPGVFPRDPKNGLEDEAMNQWCYWDGQIIKGPDGKHHLFASRWDQARGHRGWGGSLAVHAVADAAIGPYVDKGLCWPDNQGGKGHNVTALVLPDGRYAVVVSETRPGDVFVSKSLDGPWEHLGSIKVAENEFSRLGRMSNVSMMVRPDGDFMIVARSGAIWISEEGILGPYVVQGPSVYGTIPEMSAMRTLEDPVVWYSGGLYHIVVNDWNPRKAYHITSVDGIHNWTFRGLAYDPATDFLRYTDGTVNHWFKIERPGVLVENGHVTHFTFAVLDVPKNEERGNDTHGSKIIVVPFDGAALDRDLQQRSSTAQPCEPSVRPSTQDPMPAFTAGARILFQGDSITDGNRGRNNDLNHILGHGYQALNHQQPDRVPIDLGGFQTGIHKKASTPLLEHLGLRDEVTIMDPVQQLAQPREALLERFHVDTQRVLSKASPDEIKEHARRNLEAFTPGGGYVFNNVHNLQAGVPPANIVTLFDAAHEFGFYDS